MLTGGTYSRVTPVWCDNFLQKFQRFEGYLLYFLYLLTIYNKIL